MSEKILVPAAIYDSLLNAVADWEIAAAIPAVVVKPGAKEDNGALTLLHVKKPPEGLWRMFGTMERVA